MIRCCQVPHDLITPYKPCSAERGADTVNTITNMLHNTITITITITK